MRNNNKINKEEGEKNNKDRHLQKNDNKIKSENSHEKKYPVLSSKHLL